MPSKPIQPPESFLNLTFPKLGVDVSTSYAEQREGTTPLGINVRTYEPLTNRARGGQRPGISKFISGQVSGTNVIQELALLVSTGFAGIQGGTIPPPPGWPDLPWPPPGWPAPGSNPYDPTNAPPGWPFVVWPPPDYPPGPFIPGSFGPADEPPPAIFLFFYISTGHGIGEDPPPLPPGIGAFGILLSFGTGPVWFYPLDAGFSSTSITGLAGPPQIAAAIDGTTGNLLLISGGLLFQTLTFPWDISTNSKRAVSLASDGTFLYAVSAGAGSQQGQVVATSYKADGTQRWQNLACGVTVNGTYPAVISSPTTSIVTQGVIYTAMPDSNGLRTVHSGICQINATTGAPLSPFYLITEQALGQACSNFGIDPGTGTPDSPVATGILAQAGNNLVVALRSFDFIGGTAFRMGVAFVSILNGNVQAAVVNQGLGFSDGISDNNFAAVCSDGENAYLLCGNWIEDQTNNFVLKVDPNGNIAWNSGNLGKRTSAIAFLKEFNVVVVSGPQLSVSLDPATGQIVGGGLGFGLAGISDAGSPGFGIQLSGGGNPANTSNYNRAVILLAASAGNLKVAFSQVWRPVQNLTGLSTPFNPSVSVIRGAANQGNMWFVDGTNFTYYDPLQNAVLPWVASQGQLPVDEKNNAPRLIETWRGRTVLSGLPDDPQNWFMSRAGDPTDFDYSPLSVDSTIAVAGNNSPAGLIGETVTAIIPYSDDTLIFGGDRSLWVCSGDPAAGGQIDRISDQIGVAWGRAWCKDPMGTLYFFGNPPAIYSLVPGQQPQRISQPIQHLLDSIAIDQVTIRLMYDDPLQGVHVLITPFAQPAAATHYFLELRTNGWWQDTFANNNHNPLCVLAYQGDMPTDRAALIGSWDGYVRAFQNTALTDDGTPINSQVMLGPILSQDLDDMLVKDLQAVLAEASSPVNFGVFVGITAERALASSAVASGTWLASRNFNSYVRRAGHALFVQISASAVWAMEAVRARVANAQFTGKVRRRGKY